MNHAQALTKLRKLLGPKAAIEQRRPSSPDQRERERAAHKAAREHKDAAEAALNARRFAVLDADQLFQRLKADYAAALAAMRASPRGDGYEWTAGTINGVAGIRFLHVDAQADSLAELVEKVEQARKAAA